MASSKKANSSTTKTSTQTPVATSTTKLSTSSSSATPTPINTTTWKTYSTKKFNFSLKYPPDWTVEDTTQDFDKFGSSGQYLVFRAPTGDLSLMAWINPDGHGLPVPEAEYDIEYKNGQIVFGEREVNTTDPNEDVLQVQKGNIQFHGTLNGDSYYFMSRIVNDTATENLIKTILSSYKVS